ncbi:MAG: major capsid protein, partial [Stackebrandtia sp.]
QNRFQLASWLPSLPIDDLEYRFTRGGEGLAEAATFRSYDAESPLGSRPGITRVTGELPPISRKIRLGEYDRLRQRHADAAIAEAIFTDAVRMVRAIAARMELARGDALVNGAVEISENGLEAVVDFGRRDEHEVTPATRWDNHDEATPLSDLLAWRDIYADTNGVDPGALLMTRKVLGHLLRNGEIRALAASLAGTPSIVAESTLQKVFSAHGLPPFIVYNAQVSVDGAARRVIPDNVALMLPSPGSPDNPEGTDLGATLWGTTAEALDPAYSIEEAPGISAASFATADPIAIWTKAAAIGLPILANPDLTFKATVATAPRTTRRRTRQAT